MSYPGHIRTLIVEDEQEPVNNYRSLFEQLTERFNLAPPIFARSYDDAVGHLSQSAIFHLVIVDLGLPQTTDETAQSGVESGFDIVSRCARREDYPVPSVLVISGKFNQANLGALSDSLRRDFWHGAMINKGMMEEDGAITAALLKIRDYCDVGIHLHNGADQLYPTLSPREEDLLRRCVLAQQYCVGIDFEWWGASRGTSSNASQQLGITKVLWGRFLLRGANDPSRPCFFKFEPTETARNAYQDLALMVQKLSHIKLHSVTQGFHRTLIATQQVGESSARPISLADLMTKPQQEIASSLPTIASDIATQLSNLGNVNKERLPASKLLWDFHDTDKIQAAHFRHGGDVDRDPTVILGKLRATTTHIWVFRRNCTHGDLHATNIALEMSGDAFRGFIFDAGGMGVNTAGRDLAMLEVSLLLHRKSGTDAGFSEACRTLYADAASVPGLPDEAEKWSPVMWNTFNLICEIRKQALHFNELRVYALLVFDSAMLQLGGLAVQSRGNKIVNPSDSVLLADLTARWLTAVAPDFLQTAT